MAFGKKKKVKNKANDVSQQPKVVNKVPMSQNPLYPPKKESAMKEIGTALGVAAGCLLLCGVIITNFSYAATGYPSYEDDYYYESSNDTEDTQQSDEYQEEDSYEEDTENDTEEFVEGDSEEAVEDVVVEPDFVFPDSDRRYISTSELSGLSAEECSHARNEIYARHGRKFQDQNLQAYFNSKEWYNGTIEPGAFTESMLNEYEKANASTILSYEKSMGYR